MVRLLTALTSTVRPFLTRSGIEAAHNLVGLALLTVLNQLLGAVMILLLAQWWSPADFGSFTTVMAIQAYLLIIGNLGARPLAIREAVRRPDDTPIVFTSFLTTVTIAGALVFIVALLASHVLPLRTGERQLLGWIALGNIAACLQLQPFFDARHRQVLGNLAVLLGELGGVGALVALHQAGRLSLPAAGIVLALKWLIVFVIQAVLYVRAVGALRIKFDSRAVWQMIRSGIPLMLAWLIATVPNVTGVIIIRFSGQLEGAAVLGIAQYVGQSFAALAYLAIAVVQPHINGEFGQTPSFIRKLCLFLSGYLGLSFAALLIAVVYLIPRLLGPAYEPAVLPAIVFLGGGVAAAIANVASVYAIALHAERALILAYGVGVATFLGLAALLVPSASYHGVALANLISNITCALFLLGCIRWMRSTLARPSATPD
jgi:O-antigen/teichoic acid export membrane protein